MALFIFVVTFLQIFFFLQFVTAATGAVSGLKLHKILRNAYRLQMACF